MPFTFLSVEDIVSGPGSEWEPQLFLAAWGSRDSGLSCPYKPVTGRWILTGDREQKPTFLPQGVKRVGGKEDYKPHLDGVVRRRRWKLTVVNNKCECASHQVTEPRPLQRSVKTWCWFPQDGVNTAAQGPDCIMLPFLSGEFRK